MPDTDPTDETETEEDEEPECACFARMNATSIGDMLAIRLQEEG